METSGSLSNSPKIMSFVSGSTSFHKEPVILELRAQDRTASLSAALASFLPPSEFLLLTQRWPMKESKI